MKPKPPYRLPPLPKGHPPTEVVVVETGIVPPRGSGPRLVRVRCPRCKKEFVRQPHGRAAWSGFVWRCHGDRTLHGYYDPAKRTGKKS